MALFSKGIFGLDGPSLMMVFSLGNILMYLLMLLLTPQMWFLYLIGSFLDLTIIIGVLRSKKAILTIFLVVYTVVFVIYSVFSLVAIGVSFFLPVDNVVRPLREYVKVEDHVLAEEVLEWKKATVAFFIFSCIYCYCYLCALNAARKQCTEVYRVSTEIEDDTGLEMRRIV